MRLTGVHLADLERREPIDLRDLITATLMDLRMTGPWFQPPSTLNYQQAMRHYADLIVRAIEASAAVDELDALHRAYAKYAASSEGAGMLQPRPVQQLVEAVFEVIAARGRQRAASSDPGAARPPETIPPAGTEYDPRMGVAHVIDGAEHAPHPGETCVAHARSQELPCVRSEAQASWCSVHHALYPPMAVCCNGRQRR